MGESDGDKKKGGVPSWQLKSSGSLQDNQKESQDTAPQPTPSRAIILENARRFLLEDEVRNAPTDKQVAFLEGKGLESHEIQDILGVARNAEATAPTPELSPSETPSNDQPSQKSTESSSIPISQTNHDVPPIITYPEFLIIPVQPAPLITARRLLATLYLFGGLSALLYGTSHYLITPMIAALTSSRHELAGTAQQNLDRLVARLQEMVSETPPLGLLSRQDELDCEDSDSDPTELFHRDIGVQTSIPPSPSVSRPTSPPPSTTALSDQITRLEMLTSHLRDLNEASKSEGSDAFQLSSCINILREHLYNMAYVPPTYSYGAGGLHSGASQKTEVADDEITKLKAQIRSVKGVLLSARSFPAGTGQGRVR